MPNFNFIERIVEPIHNPNNNNIFIYPINGIDLKELKKITIGNVTFIDKTTAISNYNNVNYNFPVNSYAVVDLSNQTFNKTYDNGLNSVALKILKETIGILNISVYSITNIVKERKITISNIDKHFLEEGLIRYLSAHKDRVYIENTRFDTVDLTMTTMLLVSITREQDPKRFWKGKTLKTLRSYRPEVSYSWIMIISFTGE